MRASPLLCRASRAEAMRVLLVTHYFAEHRGGVEIVAGELARRLAARGVQITWLASQSAEPAAPAKDEAVMRRPIYAWNFTEQRLGFPYPLWSPLDLLRLSQQVRNAEVVHLHDS